MTDPQQPGQEPKKKAGSIRQYATLGRGSSKTPERLDVQTPEHLDTETSERPDVQELERSESKAVLKRERHTIYLPPELSEWVKIRAVKTKREISELVTEAIERYRTEVE